jgi:hypothetical protein
LRTDDLFNFRRVLHDLLEHDWDDQPYGAIIGQSMSGKTRLLREYSQLLLPEQVITLDSKILDSRMRIAMRASVCIKNPGALPTLRIHLSTGDSQIVISGSSFSNSRLTIRANANRRWFRRSRPIIEQSRRTQESAHLIGALLDDLDHSGVNTWILVDHFESATEPMREFVDDVSARLGGSGGLRLLIAQQSNGYDPPAVSAPAVGGQMPRVYQMGTLSPRALMTWAEELGLAVPDEMATMLHAVAGGGLAGRAWQALMELQIRDGAWSGGHATERRIDEHDER